MPFPAPEPADASLPPGSARTQSAGHGRLAEGLALSASALALGLALLSLWWQRGEAVSPATPWLCALAVGAAATGVCWMLVRQRSVEAAVRDARLEASALAELLDAWHWRTDAAHRLTLLRPPRQARCGCMLEAAAGSAIWDLFDADRGAAAALRGALEAHGALDGLRVCHRAADGRRLPFHLQAATRVDAQGRFAGHVGTARLRDEDEALRDDRRALETLLEALPTPVFLLADPARRADDGEAADAPRPGAERTVARCNRAARRALGLDDSLPLPPRWDALLPRLPAALAEAVQQRLGAAASDAPALDAPPVAGWRLLARSVPPAEPPAPGEPDVRVTLVVLLPEAGFDDALQPAAVPADDADREAFGYTVSHDLRAPLRVVDGFARILKEDYGAQLDRVGNDHLDRVLGAASRMNSMIDALLALSRLSSQPLLRQPVDLSQLAAYVVDELRRQSPARTVEVRIAPGLRAEGDPTLLRIALENLLGNAWKYSAKVERAEIAFEAEEQGGRTVYTVRDNGAGFDMRFADRLFGVFQRLHSASDFQGTGVGLASVRRIVRRHGGDIWAESQVGRGSRFHFTLAPAADAPATSADGGR